MYISKLYFRFIVILSSLKYCNDSCNCGCYFEALEYEIENHQFAFAYKFLKQVVNSNSSQRLTANHIPLIPSLNGLLFILSMIEA